MRKTPLIVPRQHTQDARINCISLAQPLLAHLIPSVQRTQAARTKEIVLIMGIMFCLQSPWAAHFIHGYTGTLLKDRASCTSLVQKIIKIYRMSNTNWSPLSYIYVYEVENNCHSPTQPQVVSDKVISWNITPPSQTFKPGS